MIEAQSLFDTQVTIRASLSVGVQGIALRVLQWIVGQDSKLKTHALGVVPNVRRNISTKALGWQ
jgi:hypothetical protein